MAQDVMYMTNNGFNTIKGFSPREWLTRNAHKIRELPNTENMKGPGVIIAKLNDLYLIAQSRNIDTRAKILERTIPGVEIICRFRTSDRAQAKRLYNKFIRCSWDTHVCGDWYRLSRVVLKMFCDTVESQLANGKETMETIRGNEKEEVKKTILSIGKKIFSVSELVNRTLTMLKSDRDAWIAALVNDGFIRRSYDYITILG